MVFSVLLETLETQRNLNLFCLFLRFFKHFFLKKSVPSVSILLRSQGAAHMTSLVPQRLPPASWFSFRSSPNPQPTVAQTLASAGLCLKHPRGRAKGSFQGQFVQVGVWWLFCLVPELPFLKRFKLLFLDVFFFHGGVGK